MSNQLVFDTGAFPESLQRFIKWLENEELMARGQEARNTEMWIETYVRKSKTKKQIIKYLKNKQKSFKILMEEV